MWEKIAFHRDKIFAIIGIVLVLYWLSVSDEEIDDPYIISVDYDCKEIVRDPSDIPRDIVEQCKTLVIELEKQNAPKQSQRSLTT